jgi:hypothetical protein
MVVGRKKHAPRVAEEGGHIRPGVKGKNLWKDEEEQLCRSVLHVTQDRIVGNQQRASVFWDRITTHYQENQPQGPGRNAHWRPSGAPSNMTSPNSLESTHK